MEIFLPIQDKNGAQAVFSIMAGPHRHPNIKCMLRTFFEDRFVRKKEDSLLDTLDIQDVLLTIIGSETPLN